MPNANLIAQCQKNKISISTVTVYTHTPGCAAARRWTTWPSSRRVAYGLIESNPNQLPQIFIKEATVVRRSLIHEDAKGIPLNSNFGISDMMKGMEKATLPPVFGMVLTSKKPNPQIEMPIYAGKNNDPILTHWQTGLGKKLPRSRATHNTWAAQWVGSQLYSKFWAAGDPRRVAAADERGL